MVGTTLLVCRFRQKKRIFARLLRFPSGGACSCADFLDLSVPPQAKILESVGEHSATVSEFHSVCTLGSMTSG